MKRFESKARHRAAVSTLTAAPVVLFAVLALIASIAFVGITARDRADAFIQYDAQGNGSDGKPVITAKMTHPEKYPENKSTFRYKGSVTFAGVPDPSEGTGQKIEVTVTADDNAPFDSVPTPGNGISVNSGNLEAVEGFKNTDRIAKFEVSGYKTGNVVVTLDASATLKKDIPEATMLYGTIAGEFYPSTSIRIDRGKNTITTKGLKPWPSDMQNLQIGSCDAQTHSEFKLPEGGYLMDLKFADAWGNGNIEFPIDFGADEHNTATVILPNNGGTKNISDYPGTYIRPDNSRPYYENATPSAGDDQKVDVLKVLKGRNPRWVDSYNWEYDPKYNTGKTWLPAGTEIHVERTIRYTGCKDGFATNGILNRANSYIVNLEIGKNATPIKDADSIGILTPGVYKPPAACEDVEFIFSGNNIRFGQFKGIKSNNVTTELYNGNIKQQTDALAVTNYNKGNSKWTPADKLWTFQTAGKDGSNGQLQYLDTTISTNPAKNYETMTGGPTKFAGSLAFDINGYLWGNSKTREPVLYKANIGAQENTWTKVASVSLPGNPHSDSNSRIKDLAFGENGDLFFVYESDADNPTTIWKIPSADLDKAKGGNVNAELLGQLAGNVTYTNLDGKKVTKDWGKLSTYGLAFGPDNKMYVSGPVPELVRVPFKNPTYVDGNLTLKVKQVSYDGVLEGIGDLASCALPDGEEGPKDPKYKVEKRAIDPETGEIAPIGTESNPVSEAPNKIDLNTSGDTFDVNYAVSIANIGGKAGLPGDITDDITLPDGFVVDDVKIGGVGDTKVTPAGLTKTRNTASFQFTNIGKIDAQSSKTFTVTVTVRIEDLGSVKENELECKTEASQGGFFNSVTMQGDDVTYDNNACIPGEKPKTAKIRVVKKIVDSSGVEIGQEDASAFQVGAIAARVDGVMQGQGGVVGPQEAPGGGKFAVVRAGTYQLGESPVVGKEAIAGKYRPYESWTCGGTGSTFDAENNTVELAPDGQATCVIKNTPFDAYVQKFAFYGDDGQKDSVANGYGDIHVGETVLLEANTDDANNVTYTGDLVYTVAVKTESEKNIQTRPIEDAFTMPAGLKWRPGAEATVTALTDKAGDAVAVLPASESGGDWAGTDPDFNTEGTENGSKVQRYSEAAFTADVVGAAALPQDRKLNTTGATLSQGIKNLSRGEEYRFKVVVPVQAVSEDEAKGNDKLVAFKDRREQLKKCGHTDSPSKLINDSSLCAVNGTSMVDESSTYLGPNAAAGQYLQDNFAGIPVELPRPYVVKIAKDQSSEQGQHVGNNVVLTAPDYAGELTYVVSVRNRQDQTVNSGPIRDHFVLPAGLEWNGNATVTLDEGNKEGAKVVGAGDKGAWVDLSLTKEQLGAEEGALLAKDITGLTKDSVFNFLVTIPVKAVTGDGEGSFTSVSKKLGKCETSDSSNHVSRETEYGVINTVLMSDEDKVEETDDPSKDNVACIPVKLPKAHVVKLALNPETEGAESHVGKVEPLSYDGTGYTGKLEYKISVRSSNEWADANGGISSGPVTDTFVPPAGLEWDRDEDGYKVAKVELLTTLEKAEDSDEGKDKKKKYTEVTKPGGGAWDKTLQLTKDELAQGAVIADDVKYLKSTKPVEFKISIPVRAIDDKNAEGEANPEPFTKHAKPLGECAYAGDGEDVITDVTKGAVNEVSINNEDHDYSENHTKDNKACVPVKIYKAHVVKLAANADPEKGQHAGKVVPLSLKDGKYKGDLTYTISVRSAAGNEAADTEGINSGEIKDQFTVPAGLEWQDGMKATVKIVKDSAADAATAVNPKGEDWIDSEESLELTRDQLSEGAVIASNVKGLKTTRPFNFEITIPVQAVDGEGESSFTHNSETLGECVVDTERENVIGDKTHGATNTVSLAEGREDTTYSKTHEEDNTACVPVKIFKPYVIKRAHNIDTNKGEHVGTAVVLEPKTVAGDDAMTGVLRYDIAVTWDGEEGMDGINTGSITDTFTVPTGLLWHTGKDAKVTVGSQPEGSKAFLPGSKTEKWGTNGNDARTFSEDDLAKGAELSAGITGLKPNTEYVFTIEIPVMANLVEGEEGFAERREILKECAAEEEGDKVIKDTEYGATNKVALTDEDQTYSDNWEKDNVACIPVDMPGNFTVIKTAEKGSGWDTIGDPRETQLDRDKGTATTNAVYRIEVQNESETAQELPQVVDTMNLPKGADITGRTGEDVSELVTIEPIDKEGNPAGDFKEGMKPSVTVTEKDGVNVLSATIAKGSIDNQVPGTADKPANSVFFKLTVPLTFSVKDTNWKKIAECESKSGEGFTGGLVNRVTVKKIDGTGEETSEACEPVNGHWRIAKYAPAESDPENQAIDGYDKIGLPTGFKDGAYKTSYLIKVTNDTGKDEVQPDFTEYAGESFKKESEPNVTMAVTYAGDDYVKTEGDVTAQYKKVNDSESAGPLENVSVFDTYTIGSQDNKVVPNGTSVYYKVVITYTPELVDGKLPKLSDVVTGECEGTEGETSATPGVWNKVEMTEDSDGSENNEACVPLKPGRPIIITKTDAAGNPIPRYALEKMEFTIYPDADGTPDRTKPMRATWINGLAAETSDDSVPGVLISKNLSEEQAYWLFETRAPEVTDSNYELLPQGLKFMFTTPEGASEAELRILNGDDVDATVQDDDNFKPNTFVVKQKVLVAQFNEEMPQITVRDPQAMTMPHSGGLGEWPFALGGMVLIGAALLLTTRKTSGVSVRS